MTVWLALLAPGAYLLGALPASYLVARSRGIDLRQYGTGQAGAGNLWRMTSWKLGLPVGLFDLGKGMVMVLAARAAGLDAAQQLAVGMAAIAGHNWSVFLRFNGGRGLGTTIGVVFIMPLVNDMSAWIAVTFFVILITGTLAVRSSPVAALMAAASLPLVSWGLREPLPVILGFLAIFLIIVAKRLTAPRPADGSPVKRGDLMLNRLLFDRDIRDRKTWLHRKPGQTAGGGKG